jgi:hypothetical protein
MPSPLFGTTSIICAIRGLIGREAKNLLKRIALWLTAKWEQPYSVVRGFVNARINLSILGDKMVVAQQQF